MNIILFLVAILISLIATININRVYSKYQKEKSKSGLTGFETAKKILEANGLEDIYIIEKPGTLTDHYNPNSKVIALSTDVFHGDSISSISVAAHECGHAIQDKEDYIWLKIRSLLVGPINFTTKIAYILLLFSLILQYYEWLYIALAMVLISLLFQIITLPVELDASKRALKQLEKCKIITKKEKNDSYTVLRAAAGTYIASVLSSLLELFRILLMIKNKRR